MSKTKNKKLRKNKKASAVKPMHRQGKKGLNELELILNRIVELYQQRNIKQALNLTEKTLIKFPGQAVLLGNAGAFSMLLGEQEKALGYYKQSLLIEPDSPEVYNNMGNLFKQQNRYDEAESAYLHALELKSDFAQVYNNLGNVYRELGRYDEVEAVFMKALKIQPEYIEVFCNLGSFLSENNRFNEAELIFKKALRFGPNSPETYNNYGNFLKKTGRYQEAEQAFKNALQLRPSYTLAYFNLGKLAVLQNNFLMAESCFKKVLSINADYIDAQANLALVLLRLGKYKEGWAAYESRYKLDQLDAQSAPPIIDVQQWQGEALQGRNILVWPEQGLGDEIQFVRYLPFLKAEGVKHLTLVCRKPLIKLFSLMPCVNRLICQDDFLTEDVSGLDYWVFMMSLPFHFKTTLETIPAALPYLSSSIIEQEKWKGNIPQSGLRVACVWKGNAMHKNDANRSLPSLATLKPLWDIEGITFISLQKGAGESEALFSSESQPITSLGDKVQDLADTAAIIAQLDLVICVDTAVAHLAGALNKPCWVLLPMQETDCRWLLDQDSSPWYPIKMHLFRQKIKGDWDSVILEVLEALKTKIIEHG